jgi:hypothetical protein
MVRRSGHTSRAALSSSSINSGIVVLGSTPEVATSSRMKSLFLPTLSQDATPRPAIGAIAWARLLNCPHESIGAHLGKANTRAALDRFRISSFRTSSKLPTLRFSLRASINSISSGVEGSSCRLHFGNARAIGLLTGFWFADAVPLVDMLSVQFGGAKPKPPKFRHNRSSPAMIVSR